MKIIDTIWFSPMGSHIGIVMTVNDQGEKKAYIKAVTGIDEKVDEQEIMDWGAKITLQMAQSIVNHLSKPMICDACQEINCECKN